MKKDNTLNRKIFITIGSYSDKKDESSNCFSWGSIDDARKGFFDSDYNEGMISDDEMSDDEVSAIFGEFNKENGIYEIKMNVKKLDGCPCCGK